MVTFEYHGRNGNNIFQYVFARLIADKNRLQLKTPWYGTDFIQMTPPSFGRGIAKPLVVINDLYHDQHDKPWFSEDFSERRVHCSGFFQSPMYYDGRREEILKYFVLPDVSDRPDSHVVMHVRLGDYADPGLRSVINPNWYGKILQNMGFHPKKKKLFIVTDEPNNNYFTSLRQFQPTIISRSPQEDFHFIREFNNIICGNSSFSWWAAWLSKARRIWTFSRWMREPHGHVIKLAYTNWATSVDGEWLN